ncbi:putative N-acetyltransferase HLS1-like [Senna tora]|uniref:Putative N-acetyltransferase HLS1-like n=1 Tax=Senna tora TaxID=362788 RepID=A0A834SLT5_9FABA|nr:putative N-acetyltransferase HLS1-like [Senna tora]
MMMGDPLSRIRFYPLHVMLVAELIENGELVGVIRGCIKNVGTHSGSILKMGCILGLRVSPNFRRKGVGQKLMSSVEEWMVKNGAEYTLLATEKKNEASRNLFTIKCNYSHLSSLLIFVHPTTNTFLPKHFSIRHIKIEKLIIEEASSLYGKIYLKPKDLFPKDMDAILKEKLNLGTWVCYYKDEANYDHHNPNPNPLGFLHTTLNHARDKIFPCLRMLVSNGSNSSLSRPFGFLFMYGFHGEGDNLGELMECIWRFTSRLGESMKGCKVIITELGLGDPLVSHVPKNSASMSYIEDLWYIKRLSGHGDLKDEVGNVFVDPRDF